MANFRRSLMVACVTLLLTLSLAACDGIGPQGTNTGNTTTNTKTNYQATGATPTAAHSTPKVQATTPAYNYGPTPTSTTATTTGKSAAFIQTTIVTISGKQVHVLTTNKGFILYYYMKDTMLSSNCTGGCAQAWPPLLAPAGMMTISSSVMLPKKLSIHMTANGNQVFYDGHALYTYTQDTKPGQFSGRGVGNAWYLVGITL